MRKKLLFWKLSLLCNMQREGTIYLWLHWLPWRVKELCGSLVIASLLLWVPLRKSLRFNIWDLSSGTERLRKGEEM